MWFMIFLCGTYYQRIEFGAMTKGLSLVPCRTFVEGLSPVDICNRGPQDRCAHDTDVGCKLISHVLVLPAMKFFQNK